MLLNKLKDRMARRSRQKCPLRSDCRREADQAFAKDLFSRDWETFVIRQDPVKNSFEWFTLCCEPERATCAPAAAC